MLWRHSLHIRPGAGGLSATGSAPSVPPANLPGRGVHHGAPYDGGRPAVLQQPGGRRPE